MGKLLGRNNAMGIAFGALLWAFLDKSALALDNVGVPREIAWTRSLTDCPPWTVHIGRRRPLE